MSLTDLNEQLNPKKKDKDRIDPEAQLEDKSVPYVKLQLSGKVKNSDVADNAAIPASKLNSDVQYKHTVQEQSLTTNTKLSNQIIQRGWGYITGDDSAKQHVTVTLPVAFNNADYDVVANYIGTNSASNPTSRSDMNTSFQACVSKIFWTPKTSQTFSVELRLTTGVFGTQFRQLYNWIAIGTKT